MRNTTVPAGFLLAAGLAFVAGGCASSTAPAPAPASAVAGPAAATGDGRPHGMESEKLRGMMKVLKSNRAARWPQELDADREADDAFAEIEREAAAVEAAAAKLPALLPESGVSEADRQEFAAKAADLVARAQALERAARRRDEPAVHREEAALTAACRACHARFRPSGDEDRLLD